MGTVGLIRPGRRVIEVAVGPLRTTRRSKVRSGLPEIRDTSPRLCERGSAAAHEGNLWGDTGFNPADPAFSNRPRKAAV